MSCSCAPPGARGCAWSRTLCSSRSLRWALCPGSPGSSTAGPPRVCCLSAAHRASCSVLGPDRSPSVPPVPPCPRILPHAPLLLLGTGATPSVCAGLLHASSFGSGLTRSFAVVEHVAWCVEVGDEAALGWAAALRACPSRAASCTKQTAFLDSHVGFPQQSGASCLPRLFGKGCRAGDCPVRRGDPCVPRLYGMTPAGSRALELGCGVRTVPGSLSGSIPPLLSLLCGGHLVPMCSLQAN